MGFGSPTRSSAFAYPSVVVAKNTPTSGNPKESSSDSDDKATDYVIPAQVTKPNYSDVASKMMV